MNEVLDHILSRLGDTKLDPDPYPHFFIKNIFPEDFYTALLLNLPDIQKYVCVDDWGNVADERNSYRSIFRLEPSGLEQLDLEKKKFWDDLTATLESETFASAIMSYTFAHLKQRFFGNLDLPVHSSTSLCQTREGYSLGPHTDSPHKIVTIIFYLAPDTNNENVGTTVYVPLDKEFKCDGGPHYEFSEFEKIKSAPFIPNSLFGFVKTDTSFHGVEELRKMGITRNTLAYILSLK